MAYPRLEDNGSTVILDLHGATVDEAVLLTRRTVAAAVRCGRTSVKVIHGTSTSRANHRNRTIKHTLHSLLDEGRLSKDITNSWRSDGHLILSLPLGGPIDSTPIRLRDVMN